VYLLCRPVEPVTAVGPGQHPRLKQRADDLLDEERVALCLVGHHALQPGWRFGLQHAPDEHGALLLGQGDQREAGGVGPLGGVFVAGPGGEDEEDRRRRHHVRQGRQGLIGGLVRPVQVLEDDDEGSPGGQLDEKGTQRVEEPGPALSGVHALHLPIAGVDAEEEAEVRHGGAGGLVPAGASLFLSGDDGALVVRLLAPERPLHHVDQRQARGVPTRRDAVASSQITSPPARRRNSERRRVFPRPASPVTKTICPWPRRTRSRYRPRVANSSSRPTKGGQAPLGGHLEAAAVGLLPKDAVDVDRLVFALDPASPDGFAIEIVGHRAAGGVRQADGSRIRQGLDPGREVDRVADGGELHGELVADPAHHDRPRVEPHPEPALHPQASPDPAPFLLEGALRPHRRRHRSTRRPLVCDGGTEDGHDPVPGEGLDVPFEAVDRLDHAGQAALHQRVQVFFAEALGQRRRVDGVDEEHRNGPPLALHVLPLAKDLLGEVGRRVRARVGTATLGPPDAMPTGITETRCRAQGRSALRAGTAERRSARPAEACSGPVLLPAAGAWNRLVTGHAHPADRSRLSL
jgi:hypothetical protein